MEVIFKELTNVKTCKVCGNKFTLDTNLHYIARDNVKTGMTAFVGGSEGALYDAFDCPYCGCQNVMQERKRVYIPENIFAEYDEDEEEPEATSEEPEDEEDS